MKKFSTVLLAAALIFLCSAFGASADLLVWNYTNDPSPNQRISNDNSEPDENNWYLLKLPSWYDSRLVTAFTIDMYGYGDDSTRTIDIWGRLSSGPGQKIAGYDVATSRSFILRLDLMSGDLLFSKKRLNGTWTAFSDVGDLVTWTELSGFDPINSFEIGYACHYTLDKTKLHIEQTPVPEPASMMLFGTGLFVFGGFLRRRFKK
jgi:hypothetical protein